MWGICHGGRNHGAKCALEPLIEDRNHLGFRTGTHALGAATAEVGTKVHPEQGKHLPADSVHVNAGLSLEFHENSALHDAAILVGLN